ncbi:Alpha-galactosidase [Tritrichomonas foetus]|uniref:alpha-galactosidase n=1 Tax=Tritrichomonas foetus TaxID=1144522 RepID=A0A1J4K0P5_9EUKA|nr:Alpha-galactosidase [Tritrichomonas foetus]|eukprot:OHT05001.1 Alpha-galactosidase [Tritrichomonas foetus]
MSQFFSVACKNLELLFQVAPNKRLYQCYLGQKLLSEDDRQHIPWSVHAGSDQAVCQRGWEVTAGAGYEDFFEACIAATHADGNPCTIFVYKSHEQKSIQGGQETIIQLYDEVYPVHVTLHYIAYFEEDVIKVWSEIKHEESKPINFSRYATCMLYFCAPKYYLTEFASDWAKEAQLQTQELKFGKKIIDTKLGSRAAMLCHPFFELGIDQPPSEHQGTVLVGNIGWTGNFSCIFEVDNVGNLRVIPGINSLNSLYELEPNVEFKTAEFIFTLSDEGTGKASRNLHEWARKYQLYDGQGTRLTLLNNWENTYFDFNEELLGKLMKEAKELGVDLFLLDDGWFGNNHPRNDDHAGLGDWQCMKSKLPGGIPKLVELAKEAGVKFGIWIEPEMVNPRSDLFEKHPDWAITLPNRQTYYYRNQLVLDLSNPEVQDFVYDVVDSILTENPDVSFFKWDCNSPITNVYSHYLKEKQGNLYIDHVRGVYNVFKRLRQKYAKVPLMLCSGGGARCDYEALKYFTEFWCSDDTDPVERCYIQWGFSQVFPSKAMCAHVTSWNKSSSVKFRTDVASMCKLGFDIGLHEISADELTYGKNAVKNWNRNKELILDGDQYRLVSPYESNHMAVSYVSKDQSHCILFAYDIYPRFQEKLFPIKLQGLDPAKKYKVTEINLMPNTQSTLVSNDKVYSGDFLMKIGIEVFSSNRMSSRVVEITAV